MALYRVAVLECDTPIQPVLDNVGTYGKIFRDFLQRGLEVYERDGNATKSDIELQVSTTNVELLEELPAPENIDAVLLTGSKHNSYEDQPWIIRVVEYVRELYERSNVRIIGICFGHQIIARALGAEVRKNAGLWEVSVDQVKMTPEGQRLFGADHLNLHQMHQDVVVSVPKGATNIGSSSVCEVQGLHIPHRIISLQAHPEFSEFIMFNILKFRHEQKIFSDELYESGMKRVSSHHDGLLVSKVIWEFLVDK